MLFQTHLLTKLSEKREEFVAFDQNWRTDIIEYVRQLAALGQVDSESLRDKLSGVRAPGALPSGDLDELKSLGIPFAHTWKSHEEARRWSLGALTGHATCAVDGSQYIPGRDISLPLAAVQIAVFENPHHADGKYVKESELILVTPGDIMRSGADADSLIGFRRFEEEVKALRRFIERHQGWEERGEPMPLGFLDGTLLISYTKPRNALQDRFVGAVTELVRVSRDRRVPIVGYIDHSYARDLVNLLEALEGSRSEYALYDAQLLRTQFGQQSILNGWGDRTPFFYCMREGLHEEFLDESGQPLVGFVYLQTTGEGMPARLDIPSWIYSEGLLETLLKLVRGECVVGNGYPYPIETADAMAVITASDREKFLRAIQEFSERERLQFRVARKANSKAHRR